jgi:hypothetical protein
VSFLYAAIAKWSGPYRTDGILEWWEQFGSFGDDFFCAADD